MEAQEKAAAESDPSTARYIQVMADAAREQQKPGETRQQWALRNMNYYAAQGNNREAQSYASVAANFSMQEASGSSANPVALDIGKLEANVRQEKKTLTVLGLAGGGLIVGAAAVPRLHSALAMEAQGTLLATRSRPGHSTIRPAARLLLARFTISPVLRVLVA